ncbi:NADH dehydrogenase [Dacryopinax primogenitus]|uniref:NADH:ubiquinone reductase (non-electrogenic) n=1 Tax=Dacryopinax primogenitus (strain DJM 731) TaxID=1858805 RepID=M5FRC9_DACPD|nr:NADH dehydrogenase [Dacryopinax primogenitus]EJT99670.1 NADH dehydrogenase [Dacryopinax primogenitus]
MFAARANFRLVALNRQLVLKHTPIFPSTSARLYATAPQTVHAARQSRWRSFLQTVGRLTLATVVLSAGAFVYVVQRDRNPGEQLAHDPSKKTIVVLGSGWAATSLLKKLDTEYYNVVVISPHNYFLFTPLLPSVSVGTLEARSVIQPTRYITRHKTRRVEVYEGEAKSVDVKNKTVTFEDNSDIKGAVSTTTIPYDYLIYAVGAENQTFGIKGIREHACFLKELPDAEKLRTRLMDCVETAAFKGQAPSEIDRLMHIIVVGGGPTGVEFAGELHDFLVDDLHSWYPELANHLHISLIEALPNVLPVFSKQLIQYTESTFKANKIDILTRTMVKEVREKTVLVQGENKELREIPYGLLVWAAGNTSRQITRDLMAQLPNVQNQRRGLLVDDHLRLLGADGVFALGDCTATLYAPTAQVASQQGKYIGRVLEQMAKKEQLEATLRSLRVSPDAKPEEIEAVVKQINKVANIKPFHYSHQGSLAYIGSEKAVADLPLFNGNLATGGVATFLFWRSAYISNLLSLRNRFLVLNDWMKVKLFGRDVSRE